MEAVLKHLREYFDSCRLRVFTFTRITTLPTDDTNASGIITSQRALENILTHFELYLFVDHGIKVQLVYIHDGIDSRRLHRLETTSKRLFSVGIVPHSPHQTARMHAHFQAVIQQSLKE